MTKITCLGSSMSCPKAGDLKVMLHETIRNDEF